MQLRADDFGCVPDGRVLESVTMLADSTQLDVPGGALRAGDVGKHIAVPGAVDLMTTIVGLIRRKDCAGTMAADSDELNAVLPPGAEPFSRRAHRGLRITVDGAGPGGAPLVTDVAEVLGGTTLKLAQHAATAVSLAKTILNQPDRVRLGNHVRATAAAFTLDLGDRAVLVPGIPVGEDVLLSPGAAFSSEDLTKTVTIPAAGCLVATIEAVAGEGNSVAVSVPAQRTVSDGPADVWLTDSRPGFEQLLAALSHLEVGWPGGISPPGSHRSRRDTLASPGSYHLDHQKPETHSQWAKNRGYWRVIRFQHAWAFLKGRSRLYFLRIQRIR
jgi:hypothetical protein